MDYLFDGWNKIEKFLVNKHIFLFLDYDGTLTPIAETPKKAVISREAKGLLNKLSKNSHCTVAIISGRSLGDIKTVVGLKNIIYVGNHGLEIEGPKIKFESEIMPRLKAVIRHIYNDLVINLSGIKGVLIEDKRLTISVHYRLMDKKNMPFLRSVLAKVTEPYLVRNKVKINLGKKVYEIRPPTIWDKGKIVLWLLARQQFVSEDKNVLPIYFGDDMTDEDAFRALKRKGLTIIVGEQKSSSAEYYLKDAEEVTRFLHFILELENK